MRLRRPLFSLPLVAVCACLGSPHATPKVRITAGTIDGARYRIATPAHWNHNLLIFAHGLVPESAPLRADLDLDDTAYARLLDDGWMVATTSYRRNGLILRDAIADVDNLRSRIEKDFGEPSLCLLEGHSMGGAVAVHIAETQPDRFNGVLAVGAALDVSDPGKPLPLTYRPEIPILFLSNQSELSGPQNYIRRVGHAAIVPALWVVRRDGHVNVNGEERAQALNGLIRWITAGSIHHTFNATVDLTPKSSAATFSTDAASAKVTAVTAGFGNLYTAFIPADFDRLGIERGDRFEIETGGKSFHATYATTYTDVPKGQLVAFPSANGTVLIAVAFGNAAKTLHIRQGDSLTVRPSPPGTP